MADEIIAEYDADDKLDRVVINGTECPSATAVTLSLKTDKSVFPKKTQAIVTVKFTEPKLVVHDAQQGFAVD